MLQFPVLCLEHAGRCLYIHVCIYVCECIYIYIYIYGDVYTHIVRTCTYLCNQCISKYVFKTECLESTFFFKIRVTPVEAPEISMERPESENLQSFQSFIWPQLGQRQSVSWKGIWKGWCRPRKFFCPRRPGLREPRVHVTRASYALRIITGVLLTHLEPGGTEVGSRTIIAKSMEACANSQQHHAVPAAAHFVILSTAVNTAASTKQSVIMDSRHAIHSLFCLKRQQM